MMINFCLENWFAYLCVSLTALNVCLIVVQYASFPIDFDADIDIVIIILESINDKECYEHQQRSRQKAHKTNRETMYTKQPSTQLNNTHNTFHCNRLV